MLKYELKKIFNKSYALLAIIAITVNLVFLVFQENYRGYDSFSMRDMTNIIDEVEKINEMEVNDELINIIKNNLLLNNENEKSYFESTHISLAAEEYLHLRLEYSHYRDFLYSVEENADRINTLFNDPSSYAFKATEFIKNKYTNLNYLQPQIINETYLKLMVNNFFSDAVMYLLIFFIVFNSFAEELSNDSKKIIISSQKGLLKYFPNKFITYLITATIIMCVVYGSNILYCLLRYNISSLSIPIQSAYTFYKCPYTISIIQYMMVSYIAKIISSIIIISFTMVIINLFNNISVATLIETILLLGEIIIYHEVEFKSVNIPLKIYNISSIFFVSDCFKELNPINFFGYVVSDLYIRVVFSCFISIVNIITAYFLYRYKERKTFFNNIIKRKKITQSSILKLELKKSLLSQRSVIVILIIIVIQVLNIENSWIYKTQDDIFYKNYSSVLSQMNKSERDIFINNEMISLQNLNERYLLLSTKYENHEISRFEYELEKEKLDGLKLKENAINIIHEQNEKIKDIPGSTFRYRTPINKVLGTKLIHYLELIIAVYITTIIVSAIYTYDKHTNMDTIIRTLYDEKYEAIIKHIINIIYSIGVSMVCFLPRYYIISKCYNGFSLFWKISDILCKETIISGPIIIIIMAQIVGKTLMVYFSTLITKRLSLKANNTIYLIFSSIIINGLIISGFFVF